MRETLELPVYGLNVRDCGARGDGSGDDAPAIQKALDSGMPVVVIPQGRYRLDKTLRIRSGTRLHVHPQAVLTQAEGAGRDSSCFLITNANHDGGDRDIAIEGGIWDGNNAANQRGPDAPGSYTGVLLNFFNVRGIALRDMELRNPVSYYTRFCRMQRFLIERIRFRTATIRPNQDGIHLGGECQDGIIRHIDGRGASTPNDDVVALNADDANQRAQNLGKVNGPIRRVRIYDLSAEDCHTFVRLLSCPSTIESVEIDDVRGGCQICVLNLDAARKCRVPLFAPGDPACANGVGDIRNVRCSGFRVHRSAPHAANPLIDVLTRVDNFIIEDFRRDEAADANPAVPTLHMAEIPATRVECEGLSAAQIAALQARSSALREGAWRMLAPGAEPRFRASLRTEMGTCVTLPNGGFDRLSLSRNI